MLGGREMKKRCVLVINLILACSFIAYGQPPQIDGVVWQPGPSIANLGNMAQISIPTDHIFTGANGTRILMEALKNPTSGKELGFIAPVELEWYIVFEFDSIGYVKDDEKNSLDAGSMLEVIKTGIEKGNIERQKRGWPIMTILGWEQQPQYNELTHNLEWAIRAESDGNPVINYNTRMLGRDGVMRVTLVFNPSVLSSTLPKFKDVLSGFNFNPGLKYTEFRQGDKMAKYGLSALVVSGSTEVVTVATKDSGAVKGATKDSMFKGPGKFIIIGFLIVFIAFITKLVSRKKSEEDIGPY